MLRKIKTRVFDWAKKRHFGLFSFNLIIIILSLLHTARYFDPIYEISINFILVTAMILTLTVLGGNSITMFVVSIFFMIISASFQAIKINIWAERSGIYAFDSLMLGILALIWESVGFQIKVSLNRIANFINRVVVNLIKINRRFLN